MQHYDVVVVGGGSAGSVLAARLSDDGDRSVLLVESGADYATADDFPDDIRSVNAMTALVPGSPAAWPLVGQITDVARLPVPRAHVVGGGSSVNGAYYIRGLAADFERWAEAGNDEWSFDKVLPCFRKAEADIDFGGDEAHGSEGPVPVMRRSREEMTGTSRAFVQACLDHGFPESPDKNAPDAVRGVGPIPLNAQDGVRVNTAMAYLTPRRGRPNLTVRGNAFVRRVLFKGRRAVGIEADVAGVPVADALVGKPAGLSPWRRSAWWHATRPGPGSRCAARTWPG